MAKLPRVGQRAIVVNQYDDDGFRWESVVGTRVRATTGLSRDWICVLIDGETRSEFVSRERVTSYSEDKFNALKGLESQRDQILEQVENIVDLWSVMWETS